jgi:hypothetical protein
VRKQMEERVDAPVRQSTELIARARFALDGKTRAPDATFTLRLNWGTVRGWEERGAKVKPFTDFAGAFELHTGRQPYKLPDTWLAAKKKLTLGTSLNVSTTNDIIGGNSGSPLLNKAGEIVGVVFDTNIHALGGAYRFDGAKARCISVTTEGLLHALEVIYKAAPLVKELRGK